MDMHGGDDHVLGTAATFVCMLLLLLLLLEQSVHLPCPGRISHFTPFLPKGQICLMRK